jgi:hypothetical protein
MKKTISVLFCLFFLSLSIYAEKKIILPEKIVFLSQSSASIGVNSQPVLQITAIDLSNNELIIISYIVEGLGSSVEIRSLKRTGIFIDLENQQKYSNKP